MILGWSPLDPKVNGHDYDAPSVSAIMYEVVKGMSERVEEEGQHLSRPRGTGRVDRKLSVSSGDRFIFLGGVSVAITSNVYKWFDSGDIGVVTRWERTYAGIHRALSKEVQGLNDDKRWDAQLSIGFHEKSPDVGLLPGDRPILVVDAIPA